MGTNRPILLFSHIRLTRTNVNCSSLCMISIDCEVNELLAAPVDATHARSQL